MAPRPPPRPRRIHHVLRPGAFLQFFIIHPCFNPPHRWLLRNPQGEAYAIEVGRCFDHRRPR